VLLYQTVEGNLSRQQKAFEATASRLP